MKEFMENKESLKDMLENQNELRLSLTGILMQKKISFELLAKEIGISKETTHRFLKHNKDIEWFSTLMKIKEYVAKNS